jgi:hypothetical protein
VSDEVKRIGKIALILTVAAIVFAMAPVRAFVLWLLPIGSGIDDLVEAVLLCGAAAFLLFWFIGKIRH